MWGGALKINWLVFYVFLFLLLLMPVLAGVVAIAAAVVCVSFRFFSLLFVFWGDFHVISFDCNRY